MFDHIASALPQTLAQALGVFVFMVSESVLGHTRFGSWLGLARAVSWFMVISIFGGLMKLLKYKSGQKPPEENEK